MSTRGPRTAERTLRLSISPTSTSEILSMYEPNFRLQSQESFHALTTEGLAFGTAHARQHRKAKRSGAVRIQENAIGIH